jgi:hypothetical protein
VHQCSVDSPEQGGRSHWLIDQVAHRRAHSWISPDGVKEFFDPMHVNLDIVVDQKQVVVACTFNCKIALPRTISFLMMEISDVQSCFTPARIVRHLKCLYVVSAMNYDHLLNANRLVYETLETEC